MPLQPSLVQFSFGGGINTKPNPKQLYTINQNAGSIQQLALLQNGQFTNQNQINKRFGYNILPRTIQNNPVQTSAFMYNGVALATFNDELLAFDGIYMYTFLESVQQWANKSVAVSLDTTDFNLIRTNDDQQLNPDIAAYVNIEVVAWESSLSNSVNYSVKDTLTGATIVNNATVQEANALKPKVITFNANIFIFYIINQEIIYQKINPANPSVIGNSVAVASDGYITGGIQFSYDVSVINNNMYVAYLSNATSTGQISCFYYNPSLSKSAVTDVNSIAGDAVNGPQGVVGPPVINVCGNDTTSNDIFVTWADGYSLRTSAYTNTLASNLFSNTVIATYSTSTDGFYFNTICGISYPTTSSILLFYEVYSPVGFFSEKVVANLITTAGVATNEYTISSVGLASKPFAISNSDGTFVSFNAAFESPDQSTYFTMLESTVIGKTLADVGGGFRTNNMLSEVVSTTTNIYRYANLVEGQTQSESNTIFNILGVNVTTLDFINPGIFCYAQQSNNLSICGGILNCYDGISTFEAGFHIYPENCVLTVVGSGSSLSTGQYQYQMTYEWQDNFGQTHISGTSQIYTVNVTAGQQVEIQIPTLRLTTKCSSGVIIPEIRL